MHDNNEIDQNQFQGLMQEMGVPFINADDAKELFEWYFSQKSSNFGGRTRGYRYISLRWTNWCNRLFGITDRKYAIITLNKVAIRRAKTLQNQDHDITTTFIKNHL